MNSQVVNKAVRQEIRPLLKEHGFTQFTARSAWRETNETVEEINFQSFNSYITFGVGCTTYSFAINLSIHYKCNQPLRTISPLTKLEKYGHPVQKHLRKHIQQDSLFHPYNDPTFHAWKKDRPEIWYVKEDQSNLQEMIADAKQILTTDGFPWFDTMTNLPLALEMMQSKNNRDGEDYGGNLGSPLRNEMIASLSTYLSPKT